ncbi:MAG TPA: cytochrome c1 [Burkholderiaceae bacterium]|nr:cytochrome c1 [Burkholderiaceae bacterium]
MKTLEKLFAAAALAVAAALPLTVSASEEVRLDHFPAEKLHDTAALQTGAKLFVNYCLNCHSAVSMRYNRLTDLGLTEDQIKQNLLFASDKIGDLMKAAISPAEAKAWFGAVPPDLSVTARARASGSGSGADWLYTYLRSYYRDAGRPTGWNNAVFDNVGMPHVLWELQGSRGAEIEEIRATKDDKGHVTGATRTLVTFDTSGVRTEKTEKVEGHGAHEGKEIRLGKPEGGSMTQAAYDEAVADLVAYLTYMADPSAKSRTRIGVWVLLFLTLMCLITWNLNRVYWKDIK